MVDIADVRHTKYEAVKEFHVFVDEGKGVDENSDFYSVSLAFCMDTCSKTKGCRSFAYCSRTNGQEISKDEGRCHLKEKNGTKTQAIRKSIDCTSYYERGNLTHFLIYGIAPIKSRS